MANAIEDTTELDLFAEDYGSMLNKKSTLDLLGSRITDAIRKDMQQQVIVSLPQSYYQGDNYMTEAGLESINDLDEYTKKKIENIDQTGGSAFLNAGKDLLVNNPAVQWSVKKFKETFGMQDGICEHVSLKVGEAPVLNPPWQFNELDDVRSNPQFPHMGRIYFNNIYSNFPILIFQPGRAKSHANFFTFFGKGLFGDHASMNSYIRSGGERGLLGSIGYALISVKNVALAGIGTALSALTGAAFFDASKFITFKPAMKLYRDVANNLLREFAANLGLLDLSGERNSKTKNDPEFDMNDDYTADIDSARNALSEMQAKDDDGKDVSIESLYGSKDAMLKDIAGAAADPNKKNIRGSLFEEEDDWQEETVEAVKKVFEESSEAVGDFASSYRGSFKKLDVINMIPRSNYINGTVGDIVTAYQNASYLPFLCQNTISISETFSNSTAEHPLVSQLNEMSANNSNENMFPGAGVMMKAIGGLADGGGEGGIGAVVDGAVNSFLKWGGEKIASGASEMGMIMSGGGKMAIPEVWSGSSFSRSYSIDFEFASPVGDIISIFENRIMQTILCICLAAPLQTGYNAYMAPFMVKVFSKGLFSVDFGIIESLSITHGEEKNDRTFDNFPKTTKVSVTVKDLTPTMMLSLGGGAFWKYKRANTAMNEYIATLCNLSIGERLDIMRQWKLYWSTLTASVKDSFSLDNIGFKLSQSIFMKPIMRWNQANINVDQTANQSTF